MVEEKNIPFNNDLLLINKPLKWTSFDVVNKIRYTGKFKKVGHAGTLDPLATGLLILCTGKKTKEIDNYQGLPKEYKGKILLGKTTPSFDLETEVDQEFATSHITKEMLEMARLNFLGKINQVPPLFSAIKVNGKRAYKAARAGAEMELKAREIEIFEFEIASTQFPIVDFRIVCSKGTYIRSLARDFGTFLNSGGFLIELTRTKIGSFCLEDALPIDTFVNILKAENENLP
jgi:tRNA pseudouridine55 synthase